MAEVLQVEGGSVVDLGCGPGRYVFESRSAGIDCEGFDGKPYTAQMGGGHCHVLDLSQPVELSRCYDWVMSLEVAEHIPQEFEATFIRNVHRHNLRGVILSWAIEGQGGHGHFNERDNAYVEGLFLELGYRRDAVTESRLRQQVTSCHWFRNTLMVFRRGQSVGPAMS